MAPSPAIGQAQATAAPVRRAPGPTAAAPSPASSAAPAPQPASQPPTWNTSPLVPDLPDDDDIPF